MKFRVGACALLVCLAGCSGKGPNTDFAELRGAAATKSASGQLPKLQLGRAAAKSIANAPDHGALVSYQNNGAPTKREGAFTYYPVAISEAHALKALVTGELSMPMPDGSQVKIKYERHDESPDGNWTWIGRVVGGDPRQEAIVTFGEKAVFASIPQAHGAPLSIQTRNGALFAVQTDASKLKSPNKGHNDMLVPAALAVREAAAAQVQANAQVSQNAISQNAPPTAANTVDVAIGYTAGYRAFYGSQSATTTRLTFLVQVGNQAYSNSVINGYLRLVSATEVAYTDSTSNQTALHELTGSNGTANVAIPASLTPLRTARDQYGADIAILVRDFQQPEHQGCGVAWLIGANQKEIIPSDASWAYAVVSDGDDAGTDGQSYFCAPETLVHEASHLMGSAHDRANSTTTTGRYPYSYGYKTTNGNFYTVMAYGDEGQTAYRVFSNPNLTICGGNACGIANEADNARSLNQTIALVAQFRATVVPFQSTARNDMDADGRSDLLWHNVANGNLAFWVMNGAAATREGIQNAGGGFVPVATGDFNGDGRVDIIWNRPQGDMQIWLGNGTSYSGQFLRMFPAGWNLVGSGDVDGDGKSDLLWHHPGNGNLAYWILNGATVTREGIQNAGGGFVPVSRGDFNGDGRVDIIWNRPQGDMQVWLGNGSSFTGQFLRLYPAGWNLVGSGDVDADGKSDLLWHQPAVGTLAYWVMNGGAVTRDGAQAAGGGFVPIATGDYNGDGRTDIIWNRSHGDMQIWLGNGTTFAGQFFRSYPTGWNMVQGTVR
jgi:peptidyl-Asp metalloendopeptidase